MSTQVSSPSTFSPATSLALSSFHIRLETLEKEHQWLLKQIKKKRTEQKNFLEQMRAVATEIHGRCTPCFQKMASLDEEIHSLFDQILTARKLGKQTRKNIEQVYRSLQVAGIISVKLSSIEDDFPEDFFEGEEEESDFSESGNENRDSFGDSEQEYQQTQPDFSSATRSSESKKIRQIFLRLAEIFHPDKVKDSDIQMHHTEIMKEINKAYQEGDLAKLLEIERLHQVEESFSINSEDDLTRQCNKLEQHNEFLKTQYENLKSELRLAKNTNEGQMVSGYRKAVKGGIDPISQTVEQVESEIEVISSICNFVKDFRDKKITIKQFLGGPPVLQRNQQIVDEIFEEMLGEFEEFGAF
ncbi:J domain-containing protein [Calothrix sp. CCY 0018]|uniref:J domain-containing protein n=1 Tax=Calothrix sp. CCY 0018 TaxID=3103864 RepID=UPI0039C64AC3